MLKKHLVSATEEKRIVLGLIVSTEFSKRIKDTLKLEYFKNEYTKTIAMWCNVYFEQYNKAPYMHIKDIYAAEKSVLKKTDSELSEKLLSSLNEQYDSENINVQYLEEMAIDYFRQREVEILLNNVSIYKEDGDLNKAEEALVNFKKVTNNLDYANIINIGDLEQQEAIYREREEIDKNFFRLPGDLGKYLGTHKRGDVVGYFGPAKKGKCASGDNLVYMTDGTLRTLQEVVNKKLTNVLCMDKKQKIVHGKVTDWIVCGEKQEIAITTVTGVETKVSKDHKYYTPTGWKKASSLTTGDFIATCKKIPSNSKVKISNEEIKLLAYLIADGYNSKKQISFTKVEKVVMDDFLHCVEYFKNTYKFIKSRNPRIILRNGKVKKLLIKLGLLGKLSGDKFIPAYILKSSNEILGLFLNILFTCDGSIYRNKKGVQIEYSTKSKMMAQQIIGALKRFSITGRLRKKVVKNTIYYSICLSNNYQINKFMSNIGMGKKLEKALQLCKDLKAIRDYVDVIPPKYVQEVGDVLKQKGESVSFNETFRKAYIKGTHLSRFTFNKITHGKHKQLDNDIIWVKIVSIKKTEKKVKMYDLTIGKHHNFIMNSCIVHNSHVLINNFKHAVLQRKKTIFWSIEMTKTEVVPLVNKAFYPMVDESPGYYTYPAFDCVHNQTGDCKWRNSPVTILDGDYPTPDPAHITCKKCMHHRDYERRKKYEMTVYQQKIWRDVDDIFAIREQHKKSKRMYNAYGRLSIHKKYTLTYDKMMRDIDALFNKDNFIPDVLIIDYIDILLINSKFDDYRLVDEQWKLLAKLAGTTNTLVITATQANLAGHSTDILSSEHQGGFYGKNRHVNLMVGLNQKPDEKEKGVMRFGITEGRGIGFIEGKSCYVLQDFKTGQAYLDSYYKGF